ncbi:DUF397 domain-containing protein [Actinopolymorpha pittospori]
MHQQFSGWRKATASNGGGNCVEIGASATHAGVRDTKNRDGGTLAFAPAQWQAFLAGVRAGRFDLS